MLIISKLYVYPKTDLEVVPSYQKVENRKTQITQRVEEYAKEKTDTIITVSDALNHMQW
jgi:hypothetical protein